MKTNKDEIVIIQLIEPVCLHTGDPLYEKLLLDRWKYKALFGCIERGYMYYILPNTNHTRFGYDIYDMDNILVIDPEYGYQVNSILFLLKVNHFLRSDDNALELWQKAIEIFDQLCENGKYTYT